MTVSSIGSASRTYSTWQAWEDAFLAILLAPQEGEAYIDNGTWFSVAGTVLTVAGVTTSSTNFVEARPATGQGFLTGMGASGPLRVDFTKGVGMKCTASNANTVAISVDHVRMRGLQIASTAADPWSIFSQNTDSLSSTLVRDCILESASGSNIGNYDGVLRLRAGTAENCCVINRGSGNGVTVDYAGTVNLTNCTIVRPSDISAVRHALRREGSSGTVTVTNCAGFGFSAFENGTDPTGSNNASDQTISFGTSNQASKTYANQFVTVTDAARDFRVKNTSADIYNTGTTGTTGDIIQQAANGTKDIGAWELQASGATITSAKTLGSVTSSASSAVLVKASAAQTLAALTSVAAAKAVVTLNAAKTLGTLTSVANVNGGAIVLSASQTLGALTSAAAALAIVKLNAAQTLGAVTSAATVNHGQAVITAAQTLGALASAATAKAIVTASAAQALAALTSAASDKVIVKASSAKTLGTLISASTVLSGGANTIQAIMTLGAMTSRGTASLGHVIQPTWTDRARDVYPGSIWDSGTSFWDGGDDVYDNDGALWDPADRFTPSTAATATWARRSANSTSWTRRA